MERLAIKFRKKLNLETLIEKVIFVNAVRKIPEDL